MRICLGVSKNAPVTLTCRERIKGGIRPFFADVRQSHGALSVLPATRGFCADHATVLFIFVVWLFYNIHTQALFESLLPNLDDYLQITNKTKGFYKDLFEIIVSQHCVNVKSHCSTLEICMSMCSMGCGFGGGVPLTCLPVEVFERSRIRPLPASVEVQIIQTHPQSGAIPSKETCRKITHTYKNIKYIDIQYLFTNSAQRTLFYP